MLARNRSKAAAGNLSVATLVIVLGIAMLAWLPQLPHSSAWLIPELHNVIFGVQRWYLLVLLIWRLGLAALCPRDCRSDAEAACGWPCRRAFSRL